MNTKLRLKLFHNEKEWRAKKICSEIPQNSIKKTLISKVDKLVRQRVRRRGSDWSQDLINPAIEQWCVCVLPKLTSTVTRCGRYIEYTIWSYRRKAFLRLGFPITP